MVQWDKNVDWILLRKNKKLSENWGRESFQHKRFCRITGTPAQTPSGEVTLSIENEQRDKAEIENNEKTEREKNHAAENNKDNLGQLMFKLRYVSEQNALGVTVVNCKGLPAREQNATSDPYVKLKLLPDKQHQAKTRVLRNTRDPVYDEDFTFFGISKDQLQVTLFSPLSISNYCSSNFSTRISWVLEFRYIPRVFFSPVNMKYSNILYEEYVLIYQCAEGRS